MMPSFQPIKMHRKIKIEKPTRMAKARAMKCVRRLSGEPGRSIKNSASAKQAMMATNAMKTIEPMAWIIP